MTLRARIRWSLVGLVLLAAVAIGLGQWSRAVRTSASDTLVEALSTERAIASSISCLTKLQREVTLLSGSVGGEAGGALDPELVGGVLEEVARCERTWREASLAAGRKLGSAQVPSDVPALFDDWRFVLPRLGSAQVEATTRLATRADPVAERLLNEGLPGLQRAYVTRTQTTVAQAHAAAATAETVLSVTWATSVLLLAAGALLLVRRLTVGLTALIRGTEAYGRGELAHRVEVDGKDELAIAGSAFNDMASRLAAANALVQQRAVELEQSLEQLRGAQKALVQQEKMAALGGLVAGVAHEVNTPIGVALTSGTMVQEHVATLSGHVDAGTATKGLVRRTLTDAQVGLELMVVNLRRAADLIQSFKQVAVDRDRPAVRKTWLHEWTHAVVQSLSPMAKQHRVQVRVRHPHTCQVELSAGELQQVLTNLMVNALVHGFGLPGDESSAERPSDPFVDVSVAILPDAVELAVADNGRGMTPEVAARVFEPFFTTKRGQGGSGLGMHIAYTLVTERFGGTLSVDTVPGEGCRWLVHLPSDSPALRRLSEPLATEMV